MGPRGSGRAHCIRRAGPLPQDTYFHLHSPTCADLRRDAPSPRSVNKRQHSSASVNIAPGSANAGGIDRRHRPPLPRDIAILGFGWLSLAFPRLKRREKPRWRTGKPNPTLAFVGFTEVDRLAPRPRIRAQPPAETPAHPTFPIHLSKERRSARLRCAARHPVRAIGSEGAT
jgi:hypothetical protein